MALPEFDEMAARLAGDEELPLGKSDPTLRQLRVELETLASGLREPPPADEYEEESELRRGLSLVKAIERHSPSRQDQPELLVGQSFREYRLLRKIGEGGMGAVYEALHTRLDKIVALKVVSAQRMRDEAVVRRFERERKAIGKLDHPNIVQATDAGEINGRHFLVMEYIDGIDFSLLARAVGALPLADACEVIRQAAIGLQEAHDHGLIHRDIKPSNLMLSEAGRGRAAPTVKILDLGLALLSEVHGDGELTATGQLMGTLKYMSPEQATDSRNVDPRSDVYSLGATLFKLLCGESPISGAQYNTPSRIIVALATETPPSLARKAPAAPPQLVAIVDRMLARRPEDRFATAREVADALAPFAADADLSALLARARANAHRSNAEQALEATRDGRGSMSIPMNPTVDLQARESESTGRGGAARRWLTVAAAGGGLLLLATIILIVSGKQGPVKVTIDPKEDGLHLKFEGQGLSAEVVQGDPAPGAPSSTPPPQAADISNGERTVSEWLLSIGAQIGLDVQGEGHVVVKPGGRLPTEAFRLVAVNLDGNRNITKAGLSRLNGAPWIVSLMANDSAIDDAGLRQIDLPQLQTLFLHNTPITDQALSELQRFPALRELHLGATAVTDAGLQHIAQLEELAELSLTGTRITDAGLPELSGLQKLKTAWLNGSQVTADGIVSLRLDLPGCKAHSDLSAEQVAEAAHGQHTASRALTERLLALGCECGVVGEELGYAELRPGDALPDMPFHLVTTRLPENAKLADSDWARFDGLLRFGTLAASRTAIGDSSLRSLGKLPLLQYLYLYDTRVSNAGLVELARFPRLRVLHLTYTGVTDQGLSHIASLPRLVELDLVDNAISDAGLRNLHKLHELRTLRLKQTQITVDGVAQLKLALPACMVESDYSSQVVDAAVNRFFARSRQAGQWLQAMEAQFGVVVEGQGFVDLKPGDALPEERFLVATANLSDNASLADADLKILQGSPILETLVVSGTGIGDAGLRLIDAPLRSLYLANTSVSSEGLKQLGDLPMLDLLHLSGTHVNDKGLADLQRFPRLQRLHLAGTAVTDSGLLYLAGCRKLAEVDLTDCAVSDNGLMHLHELYRIQTLRLRGTNVTANGLARLQAYLPNCGVESDVASADVAATTSVMQSRSRSVAELLASAGADYSITARELGFRSVTRDAPLPDRPFHIMGFNVKQPEKFGDAQLAKVGDLPVANTLVLNQTPVSDAGLRQLGEIPALFRLYLSSTNVGDAGLTELQRYPHLAVLHLTDTAVTDEGLMHLAACRELRSLDLVRCNVTDKGLSHLHKLKNLKTVWLHGTAVSAQGVRALEEALPGCKVDWK